jgi:diaminopimelate epimerase
MKTKMARQLSQSSNISTHDRSKISMPPFPYIRGEGCGNTFLIFDCLETSHEAFNDIMRSAHESLLKEKRDDALILKTEQRDSQRLILTMIVMEPDQSIAEFCGNGARVVSRFLQHKFGDEKMEYYLKTSRGMRKVWWELNTFFVDMGKTSLYLNSNKFLTPKLETFTLGLGMKKFTFFWTETMEPHLVTFEAIDEDELQDLGLYLNHHQRDFFPLGINLNKAEITSKSTLTVTTFERGVNRITEACGTGSTSCAMLAKALGHLEINGSVTITLKGGEIKIHPKRDGAIMSGPANIEV